MDSVTQVGSPAKIVLYSGVRANFTQTKFHDELVDDLLDLFFCKCSLLEITLCINI